MDTYDIIFLIALIIVLLAFCALWYFRMRYAGKSSYLLSKSDSKSIISHALHQMNIKVEWEKNGENQTVHYNYQGGHFNITLEKNSPYARLTYLFFFQTDIDDLETVRIVCNLCNLNTDACRIIYTIDEKKGKVDVHLLSVLPVQEKGMKDILERVMGDAFRWQNTFSTKFEEHKKQDAKASESDTEKDKALLNRDLHLLREQEMYHQEDGFDWHELRNNLFEMKDLLSRTLGLTDIIPIKLTLTIDGEVMIMDDPDKILSYKVSEPLIKDNEYIHNSATGKLEFYDPRDVSLPRNLMLDFEQQGKTDEALFYRVTLVLVPAPLSKKISVESEQHQKHITSVLIGYNTTNSTANISRFRYLWKETLAKIETGSTEDMTEEEKQLAKLNDPHLGYNYYHGRDLYLHKRFYEALQPLTDAYRTITHLYDHHDRQVLDLLDEVAYFVGCCYMNLHQYDRAAYYLQLIIPTTHQSYTEAYVNCIVNSDDFRAMDILTGLQGTIQTMLNNMENQDEEDEGDEQQGPSHEQLVSFLNFVKRRRAYLLVNKGKYKEAEKILKQLLDDPDNSDFALSELAYIQKNK